MRRTGVVVALAVVLSTVLPSPARSASAAATCEAQTGLSAHASMDGEAAVVLVHGWTGSADMWLAEIDHGINQLIEPVGRSLADQVQRIEGLDAWLLDYHEASGRWVTSDGAAGERLGTAVECLADAYGEPVGVVAHSMGGLATRLVASEQPDNIGAVVTLGTPHAGSDVAAEMAALLGIDGAVRINTDSIPGIALTTFTYVCGRATYMHIDACSSQLRLAAAFDGEAGRALRSGSQQLADLPGWPAGIAVDAIAGEVTFVDSVRRLFGRDTTRRVGSVGDWVVTADSALAQATERRTFTCEHNTSFDPSDDIAALADLAYIPPTERNALSAVVSPCQHTKLATVVEITNEAIGFLSEQLTGPRLAECPAVVQAVHGDLSRTLAPPDAFLGDRPYCDADGWWVISVGYGASTPSLYAGRPDGTQLPSTAVDVDLTNPVPLLSLAGMPTETAELLVSQIYPNYASAPDPTDLDLFTTRVNVAAESWDVAALQQLMTQQALTDLEAARANIPGGWVVSSFGCGPGGEFCNFLFLDPESDECCARFSGATVERNDEGRWIITRVNRFPESAH